MEAFRAVNFAVFPHRGVLGSGESRKSMEEMVRRIHTNWVIFTPSGMQETPYSEEIRYDGEKSCTDEELYDMIRYAQSLGLKVALKPTVNCDMVSGGHESVFLTMMYLRTQMGQLVRESHCLSETLCTDCAAGRL
jgi:hypothetical protein